MVVMIVVTILLMFVTPRTVLTPGAVTVLFKKNTTMNISQ